jgi:choline-phosphate cytidylyltransferase
MDLKRHVQDLRDNIRTNWATTGQELGKELRQFWPASRPQSPARLGGISPNGDVLTQAQVAQLRSPGGAGIANTNDFIQGYALGLVGGVRSWVSSFSPRLPPTVPVSVSSTCPCLLIRSTSTSLVLVPL